MGAGAAVGVRVEFCVGGGCVMDVYLCARIVINSNPLKFRI